MVLSRWGARSGGLAAGLLVAAASHRRSCQQQQRLQQQEVIDERMMRMALALSEKGRCTTAPNPWVGAVIVDKKGQIIGEGFHKKAGQWHAEREAVHNAIDRGNETLLAGSTVYSTLEPCHMGPGKRTPACDDLLVEKQVARVVVATSIPTQNLEGWVFGTSNSTVGRMSSADPPVLIHLSSSGIEVTQGVCEADVARSLRPYFHHRRLGRPFVVLKMATSIDGAIACADGSSQWITKAEARAHGHDLRAESQAVMVGAGTALVDKPSLTVRSGNHYREATRVGVQVPKPLRVVLDGRGRVAQGPLLDTRSGSATLIFTSEACSDAIVALWRTHGVEVAFVPAVATATGSVELDLGAVLDELGRRGVLQLMVEGGAGLGGSLLQQDLVNEMRVYVGATMLGSTSTRWARKELTRSINDAKYWKLTQVTHLADDVCLQYER